MSTTTLDSVPSLGALYARAAVMAVMPGSGREGLPAEAVEVTTTLDRDDLLDYQRTCGFTLSDDAPATYPFVLTFPLAVHLMAVPTFPFALPGLVHLRNEITQQRPLRAEEQVTLGATVSDLRDHPKGQVFDLDLTAHVDGELVWRNVATNLARGRDHPDAEFPRVEVAEDLPGLSRWTLGDDTGRRYASVSGDHNPIHLSALTAKPFGFPRPIAHGMYTAARVLAALEGRVPDALHYLVGFRSPVMLPTTVALHVRPDGERIEASVRAVGADRTHVDAIVEPA